MKVTVCANLGVFSQHRAGTIMVNAQCLVLGKTKIAVLDNRGNTSTFCSARLRTAYLHLHLKIRGFSPYI